MGSMIAGHRKNFDIVQAEKIPVKWTSPKMLEIYQLTIKEKGRGEAQGYYYWKSQKTTSLVKIHDDRFQIMA